MFFVMLKVLSCKSITTIHYKYENKKLHLLWGKGNVYFNERCYLHNFLFEMMHTFIELERLEVLDDMNVNPNIIFHNMILVECYHTPTFFSLPF